jgi:CheY-like chemotaxis protein/two-component sensor histidine kinase
VDDLLDVSRIIRGRIELRKATIDLVSVVRRALETAHPVIDAQGHQLDVALPQQPLYLQGDLIRLAQAFSNLLTNAAKYTRQAGRIDLVLERQGEWAVLTIRDTGVGIAPDLLPRVFDLFVQGDHSLARTQGGLGIGLTLVKRLVEMHGGSVRADSAGEGKGSEFQVRLPALSEKSTGESDEAARTAASTPLKQARVLVVDDNVDAAESVATILGMNGLDAHCAFDGPAALIEAEKYRPDVVVVDIGLPGIDGYEVASHLRKRFLSDVTLIAVTGYGQEDDRRKSSEAGFNHHFTKPVDPTDLVRYISQSQSGAA